LEFPTMPSTARLSNHPFPPYSYVPGKFPHPVTDPAGHMYGQTRTSNPVAADDWATCDEFLYALDLFNHGYYWEAHEAWETLWHAVGHHTRPGLFLKGLIKLAAAGVKAREGRVVGVARHLARTRELFSEAAALPPGDDLCGGFSLAKLQRQVSDLATGPDRCLNTSPDAVVRVFSLILRPC
jgi:hypothetical protein